MKNKSQFLSLWAKRIDKLYELTMLTNCEHTVNEIRNTIHDLKAFVEIIANQSSNLEK